LSQIYPWWAQEDESLKSGLVKEGLEVDDMVEMLIIDVHVAMSVAKVPI
jgi:hypothetical protein